MTPRERLNRAEWCRAASWYCDPAIQLAPELEARRAILDREIEELRAELSGAEVAE
jgi:hypothetical protein